MHVRIGDEIYFLGALPLDPRRKASCRHDLHHFGRATTEQVRLEESAHSAMHWFTREELGSGGAVELETVRTSCLMAMREVRHASEAR